MMSNEKERLMAADIVVQGHTAKVISNYAPTVSEKEKFYTRLNKKFIFKKPENRALLGILMLPN